MEKKPTKIVELIIDESNEELAIDAISLVTEPAIEQDFVYFNKAKNNLTLAKIDEEKGLLVSPVRSVLDTAFPVVETVTVSISALSPLDCPPIKRHWAVFPPVGHKSLPVHCSASSSVHTPDAALLSKAPPGVTGVLVIKLPGQLLCGIFESSYKNKPKKFLRSLRLLSNRLQPLLLPL